ncbi:hypothetical protein [Methanofollis fontis]|nr:hypothetical protein [Methanofollis fontis]
MDRKNEPPTRKKQTPEESVSQILIRAIEQWETQGRRHKRSG